MADKQQIEVTDEVAQGESDSSSPTEVTKKEPQSSPKKPRKSFFKSLAGGGGCGGALGVLLLLFWGGLVTYDATLGAAAASENEVASGITTFMGGVVCFGPPFVLLCVLLGAAVGFMRWRW